MNHRRLTRSRSNKVIVGVCGGIARYFGFRVSRVRIAFVILALLGGSGLLIYLVAWIVMPKRSR